MHSRRIPQIAYRVAANFGDWDDESSELTPGKQYSRFSTTLTATICIEAAKSKTGNGVSRYV
jgi:hypothetical protein